MATKKLNRHQNESNRSFDIIWHRIIISWVVVFILGLIIGGVISSVVMAVCKADEPTEEIEVEPIPTITFEPMVLRYDTPAEPIEAVIEEPEEPDKEFLGNFRITAYCSCKKCCGKWADNRPNGIVYGASGKELKAGVSVASPLPFGTELYIDGLGDYVVQDRTANWVVEKYGEGIVDVYFDSHEAACEFGLKYLDVYRIEGVN